MKLQKKKKKTLTAARNNRKFITYLIEKETVNDVDDVDEFNCADSDALAEAEFTSQTRFRCIPGSSGEPEEYADECIDLVSCKISVISTSDTITNILDLQMF